MAVDGDGGRLALVPAQGGEAARALSRRALRETLGVVMARRRGMLAGKIVGWLGVEVVLGLAVRDQGGPGTLGLHLLAVPVGVLALVGAFLFAEVAVSEVERRQADFGMLTLTALSAGDLLLLRALPAMYEAAWVTVASLPFLGLAWTLGAPAGLVGWSVLAVAGWMLVMVGLAMRVTVHDLEARPARPASTAPLWLRLLPSLVLLGLVGAVIAVAAAARLHWPPAVAVVVGVDACADAVTARVAALIAAGDARVFVPVIVGEAVLATRLIRRSLCAGAFVLDDERTETRADARANPLERWMVRRFGVPRPPAGLAAITWLAVNAGRYRWVLFPVVVLPLMAGFATLPYVAQYHGPPRPHAPWSLGMGVAASVVLGLLGFFGGPAWGVPVPEPLAVLPYAPMAIRRAEFRGFALLVGFFAVIGGACLIDCLPVLPAAKQEQVLLGVAAATAGTAAWWRLFLVGFLQQGRPGSGLGWGALAAICLGLLGEAARYIFEYPPLELHLMALTGVGIAAEYGLRVLGRRWAGPPPVPPEA